MNNLKKIFDRDTWDEIFESISKNRTRTIITSIGVFWGIFIYIALAGSAKGLENGFDEATKHSKFFRSGTSNQWKDILSSTQVKLIEKNLKSLMSYFNYI